MAAESGTALGYRRVYSHPVNNRNTESLGDRPTHHPPRLHRSAPTIENLWVTATRNYGVSSGAGGQNRTRTCVTRRDFESRTGIEHWGGLRTGYRRMKFSACRIFCLGSVAYAPTIFYVFPSHLNTLSFLQTPALTVSAFAGFGTFCTRFPWPF